jgi:O-antigen/teichoic acid export membrane protein
MINNMKRDYLWNTLGVFAQNAISPLLLIAITRINGIYDSGIFSFAFSMAIIFWAFGMWGGRTYQVSDVRKEFSSRSYIVVRLVLSVFMIIGAFIFAAVNQYDLNKTGIIVALVLFKIVESIADSIYGVLQVNGRLFVTGKSLLYKGFVGLALFVVVDLLTKSILLGSLAIVVANILFVVFYDINKTSRLEDIRIKTSQVKFYLKDSVVIMRRCSPVFAVFFLAIFSLNIPRYFIDMYHAEQVGYFGILAMPITLVALIMSFILQPNIVGLSHYYQEQKYDIFRKTVKGLVLITALIGLLILIAAFLIGVPFLEIVFGVNFDGYKTALMIMVAGGIANALVSVFINILVVTRHFKAQFYILLLSNILLTVLSLFTIKNYGLLAGVGLFAFINVVQVLLLIVAYNSVLRKSQDKQIVIC